MTYDGTPPPPPPESAPGSASEPRQRGRHPVNIGHLVMGMVFLSFVAVWALIQTGTVDIGDSHDVRLLLPLPFIVGGAAGLLAAVLRAGRA